MRRSGRRNRVREGQRGRPIVRPIGSRRQKTVPAIHHAVIVRIQVKGYGADARRVVARARSRQCQARQDRRCPPLLTAWISSTPTPASPAKWLEPAGEVEPKLMVTVSGVAVGVFVAVKVGVEVEATIVTTALF